jgi:hypothetical protein
MRIKKFTQFINEAEAPEPRLDAKTNPLWVNTVRPQLIAMGYKSTQLEHIVNKHDLQRKILNIGGYPELDVWQETLTGGNDVTLTYPHDALDYTGDIYSNWMHFDLGPVVSKVIKIKHACVADRKAVEAEDGVKEYDAEKGLGCIMLNKNCLPTLLNIAKQAVNTPMGAAPGSIVI